MNLVTETTIEELRGYEEALSSELEALMATLSNRESMSQEEFDGRMAGAHELETRLQSVRWDIELSMLAVSNALLSNDGARPSIPNRGGAYGQRGRLVARKDRGQRLSPAQNGPAH